MGGYGSDIWTHLRTGFGHISIFGRLITEEFWPPPRRRAWPSLVTRQRRSSSLTLWALHVDLLLVDGRAGHDRGRAIRDQAGNGWGQNSVLAGILGDAGRETESVERLQEIITVAENIVSPIESATTPVGAQVIRNAPSRSAVTSSGTVPPRSASTWGGNLRGFHGGVPGAGVPACRREIRTFCDDWGIGRWMARRLVAAGGVVTRT